MWKRERRGSECTHFEQKSTHIEEKAHVNQQHQRHRYLKWIDVEAAASNKYRKYGEGVTYEDILKGFPGLVKTNEQAQNVLRNYKNKGKLYTCHRTKPQQYFLSKEQAELAVFNYRKSRHSHPIGGSANNAQQKPPLSLCPDKYASYYNMDDSRRIQEEEEQRLIAQNTVQAIQLASSGRIPTGMHNILIHLTVFHGTEQEAYQTRLEDVPPSPKHNKAKLLETKIDGYLIKIYVYPRGKVIIHVPSTRKPFLILDEYASLQLISSAYTFFPDYFLPFVR